MARYGNNSTMMDQAALDREAERSLNANQQALLDNFKIKESGGKARIMGFEIAPEIAPALSLALSTALIPIAKGLSGFVYNHSKSMAGSELVGRHFKTLHANAPKVALAAELTTMWSLLAAGPISNFVSANKDYTADRWKLTKEVKSLCEATGVECAGNEVVKSAYDRLHQNWIDEMKLMLPSLLSVVPHAAYGLKMHNETVNKRQADINVSARVAHSLESSPNDTPMQASIKAARERSNAITELRSKEFDSFEKKYGENYSPEKLNSEFEKHWEHLSANLYDDTASPTNKTISKVFGGDLESVAGYSSVAAITQLLGDGYGASMRKKYQLNRENPTSYQLIRDLAERMKGGVDARTVHQEVVNIFQEVEEDMGRSKFSAGLLKKLQDATKPIAEAIADGQMDALSLVELAGNHKVVMHQGASRSFRGETEIQNAIQAVSKGQVISENEVSEAEIISRFANPELAKTTIKKNLATMSGEEKDFFVSVMPIELLKHAGMNTEQIRDARKNAYDNLYEQVGASVVHMAAQTPETLEEHGLSPKEIQLVQQLSDHLQQGHMEALEKLVDNKQSPLLAAVASDVLSDQMAGDDAAWQKRVRAGKELKSELEHNKITPSSRHKHVEKTHMDHAKRGLDRSFEQGV